MYSYLSSIYNRVRPLGTLPGVLVAGAATISLDRLVTSSPFVEAVKKVAMTSLAIGTAIFVFNTCKKRFFTSDPKPPESSPAPNPIAPVPQPPIPNPVIPVIPFTPPVPAPLIPKSSSVQFLHNQAEVIASTDTQYSIQPHSTACTSIAATAVHWMLKTSEQDLQAMKQRDEARDNEAELPKTIKNWLIQGTEIYNKYNEERACIIGGGHWSWDMAYGAYNELLYIPLQGSFPEQIQVKLNQPAVESPIQPVKNTLLANEWSQAANIYLASLKKLQERSHGNPIGGILIMGRETYAVTIHPPSVTPGQPAIRFFDSHGTLSFSNKASLVSFGSLQALACYLAEKKTHIPSASDEYNRCGIHPVFLKEAANQ